MVPTKVTQEMGFKDRRSQIRRRPERSQNVCHDGAITEAEQVCADGRVLQRTGPNLLTCLAENDRWKD